MNLNMFDGIEGLVVRERPEASAAYGNNGNNGNNGMTSRLPKNTPLAMAYVPFQQWGEVYSDDEAFNRGTLFPELDFPFERGGSGK